MEIGTILQAPGAQTDTVNGQPDSAKNQSRSQLDTEKNPISQQMDTVELRTKPVIDQEPDIETIANDNQALLLSQKAGESLFGVMSGITSPASSDLFRSL